MSTGNYLCLQKNHLSDFKSGSDKDSVSESGTSNSLNSGEDLQKLAVILGLNSVEDVYQERFRVDRRRLEAMLADDLEVSHTANAFFHKVMNDTNTLINWPARLKVGARSKKDPHVRVAGRIDDVKTARDRIMHLLDTRSNRVTMKLDVSYTDHSHIIGKGGLTIKRVMEETGCHIHFPDSNRSNSMEKSNQVSIAGDMENVEKARARVRSLTPLIFCFEMPIMNNAQQMPDISSPYVTQIQEKYEVQVMLRTRPKLHATVVVVKGLQWEVQATMDATMLLINYMCGALANQTKVHTTLEISPMHHPVVLGRAAAQLKVIMKGTNTQILFPDAEDPNIPTLKKSNITISGGLKDVYMARQQLIGSLPLVVIFDLPDEGRDVDQELITRLMQQLNVYINVRRKPKQMVMSVVIKGIERCAGEIYEARRQLLGEKKETAMVADIPDSYTIPESGANLAPFNPFSPSHNACLSPLAMGSHLNRFSNNLTPLQLSDIANYSSMSSPVYNPPTPGGYPSPMSPGLGVGSPQPMYPQPWIIAPSPQAGNANPFSYPTNLANLTVPNQGLFNKPTPANTNTWNAMSHPSLINRVQQHMLIQQFQQAQQQQQQQQHAQQQAQQNMQTSTQSMMASTSHHSNALNQLLNISNSAGSSGYQSNFTGSSVSLDTHSVSGGDSSNVVSPSVSPISKSRSPTPMVASEPANACSQADIVSALTELTTAERRAPGIEKKTLQTIQAQAQAKGERSPFADYHNKKTEADKAMQEDIGSGYRMPTTRWAGYYFSNTSPSVLNTDTDTRTDNTEGTLPETGNVWSRSSPLVRPNIVEPDSKQPSKPASPPRTPTAPNPAHHKLHHLLADNGLDKYINLFQSHEIDMSTFVSLNEADLVEIGVTAFGARRKMLLTIADMNRQQSAFNGSAAPGAERKMLLTSPPHYTHNTHKPNQEQNW